MSEIWRHKKDGFRFKIIGVGRLESDGEFGPKQVIYKSLDDLRTWIRPASEFFDGRFELESVSDD